MMNRSKIDWCDFSWNPITGCLHECPYCYARKQARRFCGDIRLNKASPQLHRDGELWTLENPFKNIGGKVIPLPVGFAPTLHRYRMAMPQEKKLPANIFVGSMADIFGAWVPDEWIHEVFEACNAAPWHNYLFLTKSPWRYVQLQNSGLLPATRNMWYGTSAGNAEQLRKALAFGELKGKYNTFLSIEPLHADLANTEDWQEMMEYGAWPKWVIFGAETGNRRNKVSPNKAWVDALVQSCRSAQVPVFLKGSLGDLWGEPLIQEYPKLLTTPSWENRPVHKLFINSVRDKKTCRQCGISVQGKPAMRISARFYLCMDCYKGGE